MLQYYTKNFFAPVIVFAHAETNGQFSIHVVNDLATPIKDADALIQLHRWDSFEPEGNITVELDMV